MLNVLFARADATSQPAENQYNYVPSLAAGVIFVLLFSILSILHLGILIKSRIWWTSVILIGGLGEILGWAARVWSAKNDTNHDAFIMQTVLLIIMPCFFSAATYGFLADLIGVVGPEYSLLGPKWFIRIFCSIDFISIVIQAAGGAMASSSDAQTSLNGTHTMVAGIVFQLVSMLAYAAIGIHFYLRARATLLHHATYSPSVRAAAGPEALNTRPVKVFVWSLALATLAIIIRGIYRTVELAEGWNGVALSHEVYTIVLDAIPMVLCMALLAPSHPYFTLPGHGRVPGGVKGANPFADEAEMVNTGRNASKQSV